MKKITQYASRLNQVFILQILACGLALAALANSKLYADDSKISPTLQQALESNSDKIPVIVMLRQLPMAPLGWISVTPRPQVESMIKDRTLRAQSDLRARINELQGPASLTGESDISRVKWFWTFNGVMLTASPDVISELSEREDVVAVVLDRRIRLAPTYRQAAELEDGDFTYGLKKIGVPELRAANPELNGQGVTVGIIDTGIDASHPEFEGKHILFKDFTGNKTAAYDDNGHGSHVAGTICGIGSGGTQIGVAPGVDHLVVAKVFTADGGAQLSGLLRAMEWEANPDSNAATNDAPRVISNSWGGGMGGNIDQDPFLPSLNTWVQLGIFPSFAAGNNGPSESSVGSPGGLPPAFAVGATDSNDRIASFSSRGPVKAVFKGEQKAFIKPDVSAPGVQIYSVAPGGGYTKMSGTSMATPHLSGVVAVLLQAYPKANVVQLREALEKSADTLGQSAKNNTFGAGRVNLSKAIQYMAAKLENADMNDFMFQQP